MKQVSELRVACNLEIAHAKNEMDQLLTYAHFQNMLHEIGSDLTKHRRILFKKLERKFNNGTIEC